MPSQMTVFFLIRHGAHLLGGETLAGRMPGVHLSPLGQEQADRLADRLSGIPFEEIYCSPMERARETATPLSERTGKPLRVCEGINELNFGDWTGRRLDELRGKPEWTQFNTFRSGSRIPNGETMLEAQARIVSFMKEVRGRHPDGYVALVSHGDVIKSAVAYFMGVPLDLFMRIEIGLASVSVIAVADHGPWILRVNDMGDLSLPF